MKYILLTLLLAIILSACGSVPYSDNPLTAPNKEELDSSILGTWFWKDENESGYIHIGLDEESELLRLMMLKFDRGFSHSPIASRLCLWQGGHENRSLTRIECAGV